MDGFASPMPASSSTPATIDPVKLDNLDIASLAKDAVSVVVQDSIRRGEFTADPKLVASYTVSSGLYYFWARKYLRPWMAQYVDARYADAVAKTAYNSVVMMGTARLFGGKITLTNALITASGAESLRTIGEEMILPNPAMTKASYGRQ